MKLDYCLLALLHLGWFVLAPYRPTKQGCVTVTTKMRLLFLYTVDSKSCGHNFNTNFHFSTNLVIE